jgi:hypothetical protein
MKNECENQTVALRVNAPNLVQQLRFGFASDTTVLGELMQNARRAGATRVEFELDPEARELRVKDDGCGIGSFDPLLAVAESGWDPDLIEREHPFGMGFLSALFACEHITVESKGGRLAAPTRDLLAFKPVAVHPVQDAGNTVLTLRGFGLEPGLVERVLRRLAKGFPIEVLFNGAALERPKALTSGLEFLRTDIGQVHIPGFCGGSDLPWTQSSDRALVVYLQGLPVFQRGPDFAMDETLPARRTVVVHLDSSLFRARLPDRDKLRDEPQALALIRKALRGVAHERISAMKPVLEPAAFAEGYEAMLAWECLDLLNDVPVLPAGLLRVIDGYPIRDGLATVNLELSAGSVAQADIESGAVKVVNLDSLETDGAPAWMYAWKRGFLVYWDAALDSGHWLFRHLIDLTEPRVGVEIVGESRRADFDDGLWVGGPVAFCRSYRLSLDGDSIEVDSEALYLESSDIDPDSPCGLFIVPAVETTGMVVRQASSYFDENDLFNETACYGDQGAFATFVLAHTASDPAMALGRLLPSFKGYASLAGRSFILSLDGQGKPSVRLASEQEALEAAP